MDKDPVATRLRARPFATPVPPRTTDQPGTMPEKGETAKQTKDGETTNDNAIRAAITQTNELLQAHITSLDNSLVKTDHSSAVKIANSLSLEKFDKDKHKPVTWFQVFASRVKAHNIAVKDIWLAFVQSLRSPAAIHWAAALPDAHKGTLELIRAAFLKEFGRTARSLEEAKHRLNNAKQGAETPRDFAREVVQTYRELYEIEAATELTPAQQQTCLQIVRSGLKPHIKQAVWAARVKTLDDVIEVASDSCEAEEDCISAIIDEAINAVETRMSNLISPLVASVSTNTHARPHTSTNTHLHTNTNSHIPLPVAVSEINDQISVNTPTPTQQQSQQFPYAHGRGTGYQPRGGNRGSRDGNGRGRGSSNSFRGRCFICDVEGHRAFNCPMKIGNNQRKDMCVVCRQKGHSHQNCPLNPNRLVAHVEMSHQAPNSSLQCQICGGSNHSALACPGYRH